MAGNTKFMGFGSENRVTLERWGKSVTRELPGPAIEVLREMCHSGLPLRAPPRKESLSNISYNERFGTVDLELDVVRAEKILVALELADVVIEDSNDADYLDWLAGIRAALREHDAFVDATSEPGVPEGGTTGA
jgi:hypothetical protein